MLLAGHVLLYLRILGNYEVRSQFGRIIANTGMIVITPTSHSLLFFIVATYHNIFSSVNWEAIILFVKDNFLVICIRIFIILLRTQITILVTSHFCFHVENNQLYTVPTLRLLEVCENTSSFLRFIFL